MKQIQFPIHFEFKITSLANDFTATDASGAVIAYVRQKMFKFKEDIQIFSDQTKSKVNFRIKANQWLDFSAAYNMTDAEDNYLGKIARKGWASIWKAHYQIIDQNENLQFDVREENAWVKVWDSLLGEIPILGFFTGYLFNPAYIVMDMQGNQVVKITKEPSFWGRKFNVTKLSDTLDEDDQQRIMLGLMMMILLERRKG